MPEITPEVTPQATPEVNLNNPDSARPASSSDGGRARDGSPLLVFLTVLLVLVGIADAVLWGVVGYYALQGRQQSVSLGTASSGAGGDAGSAEPSGGGVDAAKQEALRAYIQELTPVLLLEAEMHESFSSVSGTNYTDDETMYAEITERTLPLCQQMNEAALEISSDDEDIRELCEMFRDYATKYLNALGLASSALSSQDMAQVTEANEQFNAASDLSADFAKALQDLAAERGVSWDG